MSVALPESRRRCGTRVTPASLLAGLALLALSALAGAQTSVALTVHNLTPDGPGKVKETQTTGVCVFCHTPHNANPQFAVWNKDTAAITYQLYSSTTTRASLNQPTGSSRLCLSCHDGILALGNLRNPPTGASLTLGPMTGTNVVGTDLSDDHPVSFVYDASLAAQHPGLVDPATLPAAVRLDGNKQMQCSACHNPHENRRPMFLRMDNTSGALCLVCHAPAHWAETSHSRSPATWKGGGVNPWPPGAGTTVAANACNNCHRTHSAGHGARLMAWSLESDNCNVCHGGTVAQKNVAAEFGGGGKISQHPIDVAPWTHDPLENPSSMPRHVACEDCHNAHASTSRAAAPPLVPGPLQGVPGVTTDGSPVTESNFEYQVCIKCHGVREPDTAGIRRYDSSRIVRTKIDPGNRSFHPIAASGRNNSIKGLLPGWTASSIVGCVDCHNNSDWTPAGAAPKGSHSSRFAPILERNYATADGTAESPSSYDLCYKCHDRNVLMGSTGFPHRKHLVDDRAPCATCHDAHGSRLNPHLINFMTRDASGVTVATPNRAGRLDYVPGLPGKGSCYLTCHGYEHNPSVY